jgi:hypothetical protein
MDKELTYEQANILHYIVEEDVTLHMRYVHDGDWEEITSKGSDMWFVMNLYQGMVDFKLAAADYRKYFEYGRTNKELLAKYLDFVIKREERDKAEKKAAEEQRQRDIKQYEKYFGKLPVYPKVEPIEGEGLLRYLDRCSKVKPI